jgi:hypothetical protein
MKKLTAMVVAFAFSGSAAAFAKSNFSYQEINAKVRAAAAKKGIAVERVHSKGLGYGKAGTGKRAISENKKGQTREWYVTKKGAKLQNTKLLNQSQARSIANQDFRREQGSKKGAFSGIKSSGLSKSGNSYRFNSKTDRTESGYYSIKTGKRVTATK